MDSSFAVGMVFEFLMGFSRMWQHMVATLQNNKTEEKFYVW